MTAVANRWAGSGVAPGTGVAGSWRVDRTAPADAAPVDPDGVERAFQTVAADLDRLAGLARAQGRQAAAEIVAVGALIAADPGLVAAARAAATAEDPLRAIHEAVEEYAGMLEALPDAALRERAADVRQVGRRVVDRITGAAAAGPPADRFALVAAELGPADLLEHLGQGLVAAVAVRGGASSHAAIIARSLGLPLVVGVDPEILELPDNTALLVDADAGVVVADPAAADVAQAEDVLVRGARRHAVLAAERGRPHVTADRQPFELLCNVASDTEVRVGRASGATGIGLLRTELPFLAADTWPTEADHRRALRPLLAEAAGWPVTVRVLDFTGDKIPPFLSGRPAGLRALLDHPIALIAQLRATVELGHSVQLRVMVPMVTAAAEMRAVRAAVKHLAAPLSSRDLAGALPDRRDMPARSGGIPPRSPNRPVPVGAMVETMAAVEAIGELCQASDFLSIGTNDLTAQVLDLSRTDPRAPPELTAHPRVLALVGRVVTAARLAGRPVSVCGDAGAHPTTLPLLLGAGVRTFSVACARIDETRYRLRRLDTELCEQIYAEALRLRDAAETGALVRERIGVAVT